MSCCYYGTGMLYICDSPFLTGWGYSYGIGYGGQSVGYHVGRPLGNVTDFSISIDYPNDNDLDRNIPYKGNCTEPTNVSLNMNLTCDSLRNKAMAYLGRPENVAINEVNVEDELITHCDGGSFQPGDHITFLNPIADPLTVIVKRDDTLAVLVQGDDYVVDQTGITLKIGFASGINLLVSYFYLNQTYELIESLLYGRKEYSLFFKGINQADMRNKLVTIYRLKLDPIESFSYIQQGFSTIPLTGQIYPIRYSDSGLSDYFIERTV